MADDAEGTVNDEGFSGACPTCGQRDAAQGRTALLAALREQMSKCWCLPPASRCSMCQRHAALILQIES